MIYRGRFAPSPTGPLHFGSLVAAVGSWVRARAQHGVWLVRIEDIDPPREVIGAAAKILTALAAFGMTSDEPVMYQSTRADAYRDAFEHLQAAGHCFVCRCSRTELEACGKLHHGVCVASEQSKRPAAWRVPAPNQLICFDDLVLGAQSQNLRETVGDFVIRRGDGWFAYQLAVVVDDAAQRISEVVRGADLLESTPRQIHLQHLLGYPVPAYLHLPLALDEHGHKLSKHDHARPVDASDPMPALYAALGFLGLHTDVGAPGPEALLAGAITHFNLADLRRAARLAGPACVQSSEPSPRERS